uniref:Uncharacterized protein n=1 Tax=Arundo donax TaxID=35708 RepID=A0A0A9CKC0_ARUDO
MSPATRTSPPSSASAPPPAARRSPRWRSPWCSRGRRTSTPFSTRR